MSSTERYVSRASVRSPRVLEPGAPAFVSSLRFGATSPRAALATTWQLFDASALGARPLIARGTGGGDPVVLDLAKWEQIREQFEDAS